MIITKAKFCYNLRRLAMRLLKDDVRRVYGIPKNGMLIAIALEKHGIIHTEFPKTAQAFVDDLIDSGRTKEKWTKQYNKPFYTLIDKKEKEWIKFYFEKETEDEETDLILRLKQIRGGSSAGKSEGSNRESNNK